MGLMQIRIDTWGPKVWKSWRTLCLDCVVVCKKIAFHPLAHPRPSATWFQSGFSFPKFPAFWREASGIPYTSMVKAWTIGTFSLTANPKSLTDPTNLVFIVWTGFFCGQSERQGVQGWLSTRFSHKTKTLNRVWLFPSFIAAKKRG